MSCEKCQDVLHIWFGPGITKYNYMGDVFVSLELLLLAVLIALQRIDLVKAKSVAVIVIILFMIRFAVQRLTNCQADVNTTQRPFLDRSDRWYILSGHTIIASLAAYLIFQGQSVSAPVKSMALLLAVCTITFQIITREHFTVDIFLTLIIVGLLVKVYVVG